MALSKRTTIAGGVAALALAGGGLALATTASADGGRDGGTGGASVVRTQDSPGGAGEQDGRDGRDCPGKYGGSGSGQGATPSAL